MFLFSELSQLFKVCGIAIKLVSEEASFYDSVHKFPNNSVFVLREYGMHLFCWIITTPSSCMVWWKENVFIEHCNAWAMLAEEGGDLSCWLKTICISVTFPPFIVLSVQSCLFYVCFKQSYQNYIYFYLYFKHIGL